MKIKEFKCYILIILVILFILLFSKQTYAAGAGTISSQTCTGTKFLEYVDTNGKLKLLGDVTVTSPIVISYGTTVTLDLNGYVLKSNAMETILASEKESGFTGYDDTTKDQFCRVLVVYGSLIINDSNPTKENKGSLVNVSRWIDKRLDSSKLTQEGTVYESSVKYTDRYYWSTTSAGKDYDVTAEDAKRFWVYDKTGTAIIKGGIITGGANTSGGGIYVGGGNLTINGGNIAGNRSIRYITTDDDGYQTSHASNGGGLYVTAYGTSGASNYRTSTVNMNGGAIMYNWTDYLGGGVALNSYTQFYMNSGSLSRNSAQGSGGGSTVRGNSTFYIGFDANNEYTKASAPIIEKNRTYSTRYHGGGGGLEVDGGSLKYTVGKIKDNYASSAGGGIYCYRGGSVSASTANSVISGNYSNSGGGAVYLQYGDVTLNECILKDNTSKSSGGAVGIRVGNFIMTGGEITNNKAGNHGGAVYITAQNNITPHYDIGSLGASVSVKGTLVKNNSAGDHGGAFFVSVMNSTNTITVDIISSTIINNAAGTASDSDEGYGGAVYLSGGTLTIKEDENYGKTEIYGNTADGGGAFYVADRVRKSTDNPPPYSVDESKLTTEVLNESGQWYSSLSANQVIKYSDTKEGIVIIEAGKIYDNHALKSNGGAFYVTGSTSLVDMRGGVLSENTAVGNGGSVCVSGGNLKITGGTISNSKATSGGGIFINNGNITMDGGTISNNQATNYGGGIYASSDANDLTLTISSGSIIGNIANKNGGGVGVNMEAGLEGIITVGLESCKGEDELHSHPIIQNNTANENGGGFWLDGDNMTMDMYCGYIEKNLALLEPGSANIYQTGGFATVFAGTVGEGVIVIGGEYDYIPDNNIPEVFITYNSNIPNNIETKTAEVTVGVEIYLPKTLFTRDGYSLLGWAYVENPTENDTIFEAGMPYLVTSEDVTVYAVWGVIGVGEIETPVIKVGKYYDEIEGITNILVSSDADFTIQMAVNDIEPDLYKDRTLSFDKNLIRGTTILMIDMTNLSDRKFYQYKVLNDETRSILLTDFVQMDGKNSEAIDAELVDEAYLFIMDLPSNNINIGPTQVKLTRYATQDDVANIEQIVSFTTTAKREFELNSSSNTIEDELRFSYTKLNPSGEDTRFLNKKMALIIGAAEGEALLEETMLYDGANYYKINADGKFIIPLNEVTEDFELSLKLISNILLKNEQACNLKAELWVSANEEAENPMMGEKVAEIEKISLLEVELPAVKTEMSKRIYETSNFDGSLKLKYDTKKIEGTSTTLEIQKKNENGIYETKTDILESVDENTTNTSGVFNVELSEDGTINLKINENKTAEIGTYRVLMKVIENEEIILTIPYNFIILE